MANIKVSEMPLATSVAPEDLIMLIQGGGNKKVTTDTLLGDSIVVSATEPTGDNRKKVWFKKDENSIYVRNSNGVYEEFIKKSEEVYSTEEQRIGTWIDGKPLYRITIPNIAVGANKQVTVDLSKYNYNEIWIDNGNSFNHYDNLNLTSSGVNWINNDFTDTGMAWINQNKTMNVKNNSRFDRTYFITLKYTKL